MLGEVRLTGDRVSRPGKYMTPLVFDSSLAERLQRRTKGNLSVLSGTLSLHPSCVETFPCEQLGQQKQACCFLLM